MSSIQKDINTIAEQEVMLGQEQESPPQAVPFPKRS